MAKATIKLPSGAIVTLEGTPEEVHHLLLLHSGGTPTPDSTIQQKQKGKKKPTKDSSMSVESSDDTPDLNEIVNFVKNCEEAEAIEKNVLDRTSQVDRTLLPLYVVHTYKGNRFGLTSGEISKVTSELGVRVTQPNASTTLSTTASRYVMGDKVRKPGQPVRYRLSRRGVQYMKAVIIGRRDGD